MQLNFHYGVQTPYINANDKGLEVGLLNPPLAQSVERWNLPTGKHTQHGDFHLIESSTHAIGAASIVIRPDTLATATESLYRQLLNAHSEFDLYRIWHFIPQINEISTDAMENYREFCKGRALAFEANSSELRHANIPAASAVGTTGQHLTLLYLAGKSSSTHIENPRQTPAYNYPQKYGPKAPAFARATLASWNKQATLFISGTASILASASIGDRIESQLITTIENLNHVAAQTPQLNPKNRQIRVYLRNSSDFVYVKEQLELRYLAKTDQVYYIVADICRKELLVEIEVTSN